MLSYYRPRSRSQIFEHPTAFFNNFWGMFGCDQGRGRWILKWEWERVDSDSKKEGECLDPPKLDHYLFFLKFHFYSDFDFDHELNIQ